MKCRGFNSVLPYLSQRKHYVLFFHVTKIRCVYFLKPSVFKYFVVLMKYFHAKHILQRYLHEELEVLKNDKKVNISFFFPEVECCELENIVNAVHV